jgi:hypothetical protein
LLAVAVCDGLAVAGTEKLTHLAYIAYTRVVLLCGLPDLVDGPDAKPKVPAKVTVGMQCRFSSPDVRAI